MLKHPSAQAITHASRWGSSWGHSHSVPFGAIFWSLGSALLPYPYDWVFFFLPHCVQRCSLSRCQSCLPHSPQRSPGCWFKAVVELTWVLVTERQDRCQISFLMLLLSSLSSLWAFNPGRQWEGWRWLPHHHPRPLLPILGVTRGQTH